MKTLTPAPQPKWFIIAEQDRFGRWEDVLTMPTPDADAAGWSYAESRPERPFRVRYAGRQRPNL